MSMANQQGGKTNISNETEDQGTLYPVLKSSDSEYCLFANSYFSV
jgi:hypothetical protein